MTRYVEGRNPARNWTNDSEKRLCKETLRKLNSAGIRHGDARSQNFIICKKRILNDSNGCACYQETAIVLDFGRSQVHFVPQVEELLKN